ncbi:hypothetical protein SLA2020_398010 [Shorea laevis]
MQALQAKASEWSGVKQDDAFAIDETNLFQKLGLQTFITSPPISTPGYTMMRKNGSGQFLRNRRKRTRFKTNTSFSCREWEALLSTLREEVIPFFALYNFLLIPSY